ncbi:CDP-alcohol phosphatidyltransferase family protein [Anaerohalosphaeraceae bacterium U12dextr]
MATQPTGAAGKAPMKTLLAPYEKQFITWLTPYFPRWIETWHLTLLTIPWCVGLIVFGWLAGRTGNLHWLWLSSLMIFLQWFTDAFDGAIGRYKDTGLIKWGFYMDHLLDYVFLCSTLIGYALLTEGTSREIILYLIPVFGGYMTASFLGFGATGEFKITYLATGPTEIRIWFIVLNAALTLLGTRWILPLLPWLLVVSILLLGFISFRTQKYLWKLDMDIKQGQKIPHVSNG